MYLDINEVITYDNIAIRRYDEIGCVVIAPALSESLVIEGDPRAIYRTLLNAADKLRNTYAALGLDFGFDCRTP